MLLRLSCFVFCWSSMVLFAGCSKTVGTEPKPRDSSSSIGGSAGAPDAPGGAAGAPSSSVDAGGSEQGAGGDGDTSSAGSGSGSESSGGSGGSSGGGDSAAGGGDSGSGGGATAGPSIDSDALPAADFNAPYSVSLEASGGEGQLVFSITEGALPEGLTLDAEGEISGTPIEDGTFTFSVQVEDDEGRTDSIELELVVRRKRWLAYSADEEVLEEYRLYLVDLTSVLFPKTLVSIDVPPGGSISQVAPHFKFSPDGSKLAYVLDPGDGILDLYVIDLSQGTPSAPKQVNVARPVSHLFDLSPDGQYIAFAAQVATDSWEAHAVDISGAEPATPDRLGAATQWNIMWVNENLLAYSTPDGIAWHRRSADGFSGAQTLPLTEGSFAAKNPEAELLLMMQGVQTCARAGWLVDFRQASSSRMPTNDTYRWTTYNDQLSYVTHPDDNGGFLVYATDQTDEPLGVVSPTSASCTAVWSPGGSRVIHLGAGEPGRLLLSNVSSSGVTTETVGGSYGDVQSATDATFITDARIVFAAAHQILTSTIVSDAPQDAMVLNPGQPDTARAHIPVVSPNTRWVAYARNSGDSNSGPFVVDVSGSTSGTPRPLRNSNIYDSSGLVFSPDSSRLAFTEWNSSSGLSLYIADMLHPTALARAVMQATCPDGGTGSVGCHNIQHFAFQP